MRSIAVSCATDAAYELRSLSRYKERFTQCAVRAGAPEIASLVRKARAGKDRSLDDPVGADDHGRRQLHSDGLRSLRVDHEFDGCR